MGSRASDGGIHDWDTTYTWNTALSVFHPGNNAGSRFAGHGDWRLPNRSELESLADLGRKNPAIDPIFNTEAARRAAILAAAVTSGDFLHCLDIGINYWHEHSLAGLLR